VIVVTAMVLYISGSSNSSGDIAYPLLISKADRKMLQKLLLPAESVVPTTPMVRPRASESGGSLREVFDHAKSRVTEMSSSFFRPGRSWQFEYSKKMQGRTPLLIFINPKSGGNQGKRLLGQLRALFHPMQVLPPSRCFGPMGSSIRCLPNLSLFAFPDL
jgi:hypothetical protein